MFTTSVVVVFTTVHCRPIRRTVDNLQPIRSEEESHVILNQDEVNDPPLTRAVTKMLSLAVFSRLHGLSRAAPLSGIDFVKCSAYDL